jgi:hypothetical protein
MNVTEPPSVWNQSLGKGVTAYQAITQGGKP